MIANLYMKSAFVQIWTRPGVLVTHRGVVGRRGDVTERHLAQGETESSAFQAAVAEAGREGFASAERVYQVLVNYEVATWTATEIASFKTTLQDTLSDILGWVGNGYCDGFTIGPSGLTLWCVVIDKDMGVSQIVDGLNHYRLLYDSDDESGSARIAIQEDDQYLIVFPESQQGNRLL